jgi:hypothetical protein
MEKNPNFWSVPVAAEDVPDTGLHVAVEAPAEVRTQLARLAGLRELPHLSAVFDLMRRGMGVHVTGQVKARVGQACVVTLEPVESNVEELVDLVFVPQPVGAGAIAGDADHTSAGGEPPEPLIDGKLDLGTVATEFLLLGIDPYPRKAGAEFAARKADVKPDDSARPFAALAALKKRLGG